MGQITIEVPQKIRRNYRITDKTFVQKLLKDLDDSAVAKTEISAEDASDIRQARKARTEYIRTGESATIAELREEFGL